MNFQKGETEFDEQRTPLKPKETEQENETSNSLIKSEIRDEQALLEAKLRFLCQGRVDVSPVQTIQIQLGVGF